jgi:sigma-B regulation protein RsbU (phosphoserine phosphatase)
MDAKNLFRKLDRNLRQIEGSNDLIATLYEILRRLVDDFQDDLGLVSGRIYAWDDEGYVLEREYPARRAPRGFRIPHRYGVLGDLVRDGYVYRCPDDPDVDRAIEEALGVEEFAAIAVGEDRSHLVAFSLRPEADRDHVDHTLNTIRHVIDLKLRHQELADRVAEARQIQMSLLPKTAPSFGDFSLWGYTVPAEEVGGDLFDFLEVSSRSLGVAIADASGHGLPAALQARDAIIGLRMGVEERLRITATLEKLNKVVGRSALASKFISLFYGELETNGNLVYSNAGHAPPLLWNGSEFEELTRGGTVLGPIPETLYERGYATLSPGSILLAYTDGITEAENRSGEAFGTERLRELLRRGTWTDARPLVEAVFGAVREFSGNDIPEDDQTVMAVIRTVSSQ